MSRPRIPGFIGLAAILALAGAAAFRWSPDPPATHRIEVRALAFRPERVQVAPGDTVVWWNRDVVPHTVTAPDGSWDSGELSPGQAFRRVVPRSGSSDYACRYHPQMTGRLEAAGER